MSDSDLCKEGLVAFFDRDYGPKVETKISDWKRTAKIKIDTDNYLRRFENAKVGLTAFVDQDALDECSDPEELYVHEGGELWFGIHENPTPNVQFMETRFSLMFVAKTFYERHGHFPDQHWGQVIQSGYNIPEDLIEDECMENTFIPSEKWQNGTKDELIAALEGVPSVKHNPALDSAVGG